MAVSPDPPRSYTSRRQRELELRAEKRKQSTVQQLGHLRDTTNSTPFQSQSFVRRGLRSPSQLDAEDRKQVFSVSGSDELGSQIVFNAPYGGYSALLMPCLVLGLACFLVLLGVAWPHRNPRETVISQNLNHRLRLARHNIPGMIEILNECPASPIHLTSPASAGELTLETNIDYAMDAETGFSHELLKGLIVAARSGDVNSFSAVIHNITLLILSRKDTLASLQSQNDKWRRNLEKKYSDLKKAGTDAQGIKKRHYINIIERPTVEDGQRIKTDRETWLQCSTPLSDAFKYHSDHISIHLNATKEDQDQLVQTFVRIQDERPWEGVFRQGKDEVVGWVVDVLHGHVNPGQLARAHVYEILVSL